MYNSCHCNELDPVLKCINPGGKPRAHDCIAGQELDLFAAASLRLRFAAYTLLRKCLNQSSIHNLLELLLHASQSSHRSRSYMEMDFNFFLS